MRPEQVEIKGFEAAMKKYSNDESFQSLVWFQGELTGPLNFRVANRLADGLFRDVERALAEQNQVVSATTPAPLSELFEASVKDLIEILNFTRKNHSQIWKILAKL